MATDSPAIAERPRLKRRWFRYWLWSLFILMAVVAAGITIIWVSFYREWNHWAAVRRIQKHWGQVNYQPEEAQAAEQAWFKKLLGPGFYGRVNCIFGYPLVRCGLEDLAALPELQQLELTGTRVDAAGLARLRSLPNLWILNLCGTNVTDTDLEQISELPCLEWLNLTNTGITDKGLERLKSLSHLRLLHLTNTRVTENGVKRLQSALPNCQIER